MLSQRSRETLEGVEKEPDLGRGVSTSAPHGVERPGLSKQRTGPGPRRWRGQHAEGQRDCLRKRRESPGTGLESRVSRGRWVRPWQTHDNPSEFGRWLPSSPSLLFST